MAKVEVKSRRQIKDTIVHTSSSSMSLISLLSSSFHWIQALFSGEEIVDKTSFPQPQDRKILSWQYMRVEYAGLIFTITECSLITYPK